MSPTALRDTCPELSVDKFSILQVVQENSGVSADPYRTDFRDSFRPPPSLESSSKSSLRVGEDLQVSRHSLHEVQLTDL